MRTAIALLVASLSTLAACTSAGTSLPPADDALFKSQNVWVGYPDTEVRGDSLFVRRIEAHADPAAIRSLELCLYRDMNGDAIPQEGEVLARRVAGGDSSERTVELIDQTFPATPAIVLHVVWSDRTGQSGLCSIRLASLR